MQHIDTEAIQAFLDRHDKDVAKILYYANGICERGDLASELYLILRQQQISGVHVELDCEHDAACLLRELRRRFRPDRTARNAARPDQATQGEDWQSGMLSWETLAADGGEHPLSLLEAIESPEPETPEFDAYHSSAAVWHQLALRFERRMRDIASFLLISTSWCYVCRRRARSSAQSQWPLPNRLDTTDDDKALRAWRRFKLPASPAPSPAEQIHFDFWRRPQQPEHGQLWLL